MTFFLWCTFFSMSEVNVKAHKSSQCNAIHQKSEEKKQRCPHLGTSFFHSFNPSTVPGMRKVHKQNQLNQDKQECTNKAKVQPY